MASEIRVDKINSLSGVGTVTLSPTGVDIAGITTAATLRATTGIVTSLTAVSSAKVGSGVTLSPDGDIFATGVTTSTTFVGNLTGNVTGTASGNAALTGSTNNTVTTVTGANAIQGEANLTFDGDTLLLKSSTDGRRVSFAGDGTSHYMKYDNTLGGIILNGYGGITFETNGTNERLRIDSSGRVQIGGVTGPNNAKLFVAGTNSTNYLTFRNTSASDSDGGRWNNIRFQGTQSGGEVSTLAILQADHHGSSDDEKGNFEVLINDGNDGDNLPTKIRVDSDGLKFGSDTAAANALDDYEEGTFTPSWNGGNGGVSSITYGNTNGANYTKIGNLVTVTGKTDITASTGGSGFWYIGNMPFNVYGGGKQYNSVGVVSIENFNFPDTTVYVIATMEQNNNNMHLHDVRDNQSLGTGISVGNDGAFSVQFAITYRTA